MLIWLRIVLLLGSANGTTPLADQALFSARSGGYLYGIVQLPGSGNGTTPLASRQEDYFQCTMGVAKHTELVILLLNCQSRQVIHRLPVSVFRAPFVS